MDPSKAHAKNRKGETPKAVFDREHKQLRERGEQWMKDTANSCMIVATLIATVAFAAAFTTPGGTKQDRGTPNFLLKDSFTVFAIADGASLVLSSCSVFNLLIHSDFALCRKRFHLEVAYNVAYRTSNTFLISSSNDGSLLYNVFHSLQ